MVPKTQIYKSNILDGCEHLLNICNPSFTATAVPPIHHYLDLVQIFFLTECFGENISK